MFISFIRGLCLGTFTVTFLYFSQAFALTFYRHTFALWRIDRGRRRCLPRPVVTLVVLGGLVRGLTMKQLRVHNKSDIDGAPPPSVPRRHLVLKKERQMWASGESRRGHGCSFSRRFKLSGQFQLSGAKGSPLDKSGSSDAPRVPSDVKKREGKRERGTIENERDGIRESGAYSRLFLIKHDVRRFRFNCNDLQRDWRFYLKLPHPSYAECTLRFKVVSGSFARINESIRWRAIR